MSDKKHRTPAEHAVMHIIARLKADPRLAYLIGPGSESFELLVAAAAPLLGEELDPYRESLLGVIAAQPLPGIGQVAAVIDEELWARIEIYDDKVHDLDSQGSLDFLANHFMRRGLDVAEAERDKLTEELF